MEDDGLVVAKHITISDSEEEGVADLSGGTSDSYSDWLFARGLSYSTLTKAGADSLERYFSILIQLYQYVL